MPIRRFAPLIVRWLLAGVFLVAGVLKIVDPIGFARSIVDYDLIPEVVVPAIAVVLPWWEVGAAALVIVGRWRLGGLACHVPDAGRYHVRPWPVAGVRLFWIPERAGWANVHWLADGACGYQRAIVASGNQE